MQKRTMGKKTALSSSSSSLKISKTTENKKVKQPPLNNLIGLLRPKVYIVPDSTTFKTLVQQLTGNGNHQNTPTTSTSTIFSHDHDHHQMIQKGVGMEALFDNSMSSSPLSSLSNQHEPCNPTLLFSDDNQMIVNLDDVTKTMEQSSSSSSSPSPSTLDVSADDRLLTIGGCSFDDLLAYDEYQHDNLMNSNHVPWFVDLVDHVEPSPAILSSIPFVNSCVASSPSPYSLEPDVSIYDYELSGLLM